MLESRKKKAWIGGGIAVGAIATFLIIEVSLPRASCSSAQTLSALNNIVVDKMLHEEIPGIQELAHKLVNFSLITFSHHDLEVSRTDCKGTITFMAPDYKGFEKQSGSFSFHRQPLANGDGFTIEVDNFQADTEKKAATWLTLVKPPRLTSKLPHLVEWRSVQGKPTKEGDCSVTQISAKRTRLQTLYFGAKLDSPGSGSAVEFANGVFQVSYETERAIEESSIDDPVKVCLIHVPKDCPPNDDRGKLYSATNIRTNAQWVLYDSAHGCGGA